MADFYVLPAEKFKVCLHVRVVFDKYRSSKFCLICILTCSVVLAYHLAFKLQAVLFFQAFCPSQVFQGSPRTLHSPPYKNYSIMQLHSRHCYSRSTQLQLWKAIQLSQMGFLVTLPHQEHRFLCNQACPKVGGSK